MVMQNARKLYFHSNITIYIVAKTLENYLHHKKVTGVD